MSAFKPSQRHLAIGGRLFHFVSYEGRRADPRHNRAQEPDMWYLMVEGRRCPVVQCDPAQTELEVDQSLSEWALHNALAPAAVTGTAKPLARRRLLA
jgi:hypothetical protein